MNQKLILLLAIGVPLAASPFANGSFETNTCGGGGSSFSGVYVALATGNTCMSNWTVIDGTTDPGNGTIDYINTYWQPADGSYSLDLDGSTPGGVSQTFDTVVGQTYTVTFDLSGNPDGGSPVKTLLVTAPGASQEYTYDTATQGNTLSNMGYVPETFSFTATGTSSTLSFQSEDASSSAYGPVLDAVGVSGAPEPASWLLSGAGIAALIALRIRTRHSSRA